MNAGKNSRDCCTEQRCAHVCLLIAVCCCHIAADPARCGGNGLGTTPESSCAAAASSDHPMSRLHSRQVTLFRLQLGCSASRAGRLRTKTGRSTCRIGSACCDTAVFANVGCRFADERTSVQPRATAFRLVCARTTGFNRRWSLCRKSVRSPLLVYRRVAALSSSRRPDRVRLWRMPHRPSSRSSPRW